MAQGWRTASRGSASTHSARNCQKAADGLSPPSGCARRRAIGVLSPPAGGTRIRSIPRKESEGLLAPRTSSFSFDGCDGFPPLSNGNDDGGDHGGLGCNERPEHAADGVVVFKCEGHQQHGGD